MKRKIYTSQEVEKLNPNSANSPQGQYILKTISIYDTDLFKNNLLSREALYKIDNMEYQKNIMDNLIDVKIPIMVIPDQKNGFIVQDGHHRLIKFLELGKTNIKAFIQYERG